MLDAILRLFIIIGIFVLLIFVGGWLLHFAFFLGQLALEAAVGILILVIILAVYKAIMRRR